MQLNSGNTNLIVGVVIVLAVIAIAIAVIVSRRTKRTAELRMRYGSEYERAVRENGSESKAEARLTDRETRVRKYDLRALTPAERERFANDWQSIQTRFVDHPRGAVIQADELVAALMKTRGYPIADFDQRVADISVHHPGAVQNYRIAHDIALKLGDNQATTEDMRNAMIHYRSLVDELLETTPAQQAQIA